MDKVRGQDDDTMRSSSDLSNLDLLNENETDDFGRRILHHQKESQLAKKQNRPPFWRAVPRARTTIPVETVGSGVDAAPVHQRTGSEGSNKSDPPLNVPREWGRRAKRKTDWSRRPGAGDNFGDGRLGVQIDEDSIFPHMTLYTGDENPVLSPGGLMASVENSPPAMRRRRFSRQLSSPSSLHHMNTTLQVVSDPADVEFNDASMLVSTPALNSRNRKVDHLMKNEIETVGQQQVTKRTLAQLTSDNRPGSAPSGDQQRVPRRRSSRLSDKENEPDGERFDDVKQTVEPFKHGRHSSSHSRTDSIALLRKLARVSSMSPSPGRDKPQPSMEDELPKEHAKPNRVRIDENAKKEDGTRADAKAPNRESGAPEEKDGQTESKQLPNEHPKSALEAIVKEARDTGDPQFGEATLASLEDIVHPNMDETESILGSDSKEASKPFKSTQLSGPLTQAEKDRRQEDLAIESLNKRLHSTRTTIRDASHGLRRIENRIEAASEGDPENERIFMDELDTDHTEWPRRLAPYTEHNGRTLCEHCGGSYTSVWRGLWTEFRENFWVWEGSKQENLRLTWLGWTCLAFWIWYFIESALYDKYYFSHNVCFPFVIPTFIFRPFEALWRPAWDWIGSTCVSIVRWTVGTTGMRRQPAAHIQTPASLNSKKMAESVAGNKEWFGAAAKATATATRRAVASAKQAVDDLGGMWEDDDFL